MIVEIVFQAKDSQSNAVVMTAFMLVFCTVRMEETVLTDDPVQSGRISTGTDSLPPICYRIRHIQLCHIAVVKIIDFVRRTN